MEGTYDFIGRPSYPAGPRGLPLLKPPFGSIVAIDMNTGEHRWRIPSRPQHRDEVDHADEVAGRLWPAGSQLRAAHQDRDDRCADGIPGAPRLFPRRLHPDQGFARSSTRICGCTHKTSGEKLAEIELPSNASGAPITYMAGGKQYIAFPVGGGPVPEELIAVGL